MKIKLILTFNVLVLLLLIFFIPVSNASEGVILEVESKNVSEGNFSIKINCSKIDTDRPITGIKLDLLYDKELLTLTNAKKLKAAGGSIDLYENYANEGRVRIGIVSIGGLSKEGELYEINFKINNKQELPESTEFMLKVKEVLDKDGNEINVDVKKGIVTFNGISQKDIEVQEGIEKIIINLDEEYEKIENIDTNEEIDISLNDTSIKKKNINSILNGMKTNLDMNNKLNYQIEDESIINIDDEGNIITHTVGNTNIIVTDDSGNQEIIPISIINDTMKNTKEYKEYEKIKNNQYDQNENKPYNVLTEKIDNIVKNRSYMAKFIALFIVIVIFIFIVILAVKTSQKRKNKRKEE